MKLWIACLIFLLPVYACLLGVAVWVPGYAQEEGEKGNWALYHTSSTIPYARFRVATFDATDDAPDGRTSDYNRGNCELVVRALEQFGAPPDYWWCERVAP